MKIIKSRIFKILVSLFIVGILLGIISYILIGTNNNSIINYFSLINNGNFDYLSSLINSLSYNIKYAFIIWSVGIICFLTFLVPIIIIFRGISLGFMITSIIVNFGIKGIILSLIIIFPCILINELIYMLLSYYSINFSLKSINAIRYNKSINLRSFVKNYLYIFIIFLFVLILSSLFEIYISSNLIKFVV